MGNKQSNKLEKKSFIQRLTGLFEKKSADLGSDYSDIGSIERFYSAFALGYSRGIGWLSALGAINYYCTIAPIANAVDLIAETASRIYLSVYDKKNKEFIKDTDNTISTPAKALKVLQGGNYTQTYTEFMRSLMSYFLITGNAFVIAQSTAPNTDIIELICAKPQDFVIMGAGTSLATTYKWTDGNRTLNFKLNFMNWRYEATDEKGFYYELKHIKFFNPKFNVGNLWGMSPLTQLYLEMEQYIEGAEHNKSLLQNGVKPSGVLTLDEEMSDNAYERARKEFQSFYSGAENAGKVLIFEGTNAKFDSFALSPRDMDYANLVEWIEGVLYSRLKIPRPLVSDKTMTYNNLSEALRQLYILAIFPSFDLVLEALTQLIFGRYQKKDGDNYEIYYDTKDIDAFAEKLAETDEKVVRLGICTYNEARNKFNLPDLNENGDIVFAPPMQMPLGIVGVNGGNNPIAQEDNSIDKQPAPPQENTQKTPEEQEQEIKQFRATLERQKIFTEQDIQKAVERIYGKQQQQ